MFSTKIINVHQIKFYLKKYNESLSSFTSLGKTLSTLELKGTALVSMLTSSVVDRGFETRLGQTKDYKIGICCFSTKRTALRRKSKDWLAWNQDNVSESGDMSIHRLLFQWANTIKIQLSMLI